MRKAIWISAVLFLGCSFYVWQQYAAKETFTEETETFYQTEIDLDGTPSGETMSSPDGALPVQESETNTKSQQIVRESYKELRNEYNNDDIVGYLKIEGTSIDYPVTQSLDNEFYLDNDIHKKKNTAGWIFLDYENNITREDKNTVIYGHNMKKDIMFHSLRNYVSEDFYKEHRYILFDTVYEDYVWEIFSFYKTDTSFRYIQVIFPSQEDFYNLLCEMKAKSIYDTGVEVMPEDRILTLSTCVGNEEDERYVVNARLMKVE